MVYKYLVFGALILGIIFYFLVKNKKKFDSESWKSTIVSKKQKELYRANVVSHLKNKVLKNGMKKETVLELLGDADFIKNGKEYYSLGKSPYGVDYEYLIIKYEQNMLTSFYIERG